MATYSLSGTGVQALTAGAVALHITISTVPAWAIPGPANPADYYGIGFIRPGNPTSYWEPFPICGGPQWLPLPFGTTRIGYVVTPDAAISVDEVFSPAPLAFPLSTLPDVALSSPASGQVLTYTGTTWSNAAASGGGGGTFSVTERLRFVMPSVGTGMAITGGTWTNLFSDQSFTVGSATHTTWFLFTGGVNVFPTAGCEAAMRLVVDNNTTSPTLLSAWRIGSAQGGGWFGGPIVLAGLSAASHTMRVQLQSALNATIFNNAILSLPGLVAVVLELGT